jgi:hypothetical protein
VASTLSRTEDYPPSLKLKIDSWGDLARRMVSSGLLRRENLKSYDLARVQLLQIMMSAYTVET